MSELLKRYDIEYFLRASATPPSKRLEEHRDLSSLRYAIEWKRWERKGIILPIGRR